MKNLDLIAKYLQQNVPFNASITKGPLVIRFVHGRTSYDVQGGRELRAKQFMTFSVSVKHKKDKKLFLHIDLLPYSYQDNKTRMHTLSVVVQPSMQLQQKETETNICTFNRALL